MPNAVNRFKSNQLIKVEKENENKDIKRKLKTINKSEKGVQVKAETVWERLSKVKKSSSNENILGNSRSRHSLSAKGSSQNLKAVCSSHALTTERKENTKTIANTHTVRSVQNEAAKSVRRPPRLVKSQKSNKVLEKVEVETKPMKSMEEILTARTMTSTSSASSSESKCTVAKFSYKFQSPTYLQEITTYDLKTLHKDASKKRQSASSSIKSYEVAPLIPVPTKESLNISAKITENFQSLLNGRHRSMAPEDIQVIKNVVKSDGRHRLIQKDDSKLFKDILKTQLQEILKQETVVKSALNNLDDPGDFVHSTPLVVQTSPQVDVIFKNVPTLEKEIVILRALGEKLEATLKRSMSQRSMCFKALHSLATHDDNKRSLQPAADSHQINWVVGIEHNAESTVYTKGILVSRELIKEFRIAHKTLVELKENANRPFYLPSISDAAELRRTSFKRLKYTPDLLMRHLKAKNSLVPFNVLEQDPMFFNSFLYSPRPPERKLSTDGSNDSIITMPLIEGGDSMMSFHLPYTLHEPTQPLHIEEIHTSKVSNKCRINNETKLRKKSLERTTSESTSQENETRHKKISLNIAPSDAAAQINSRVNWKNVAPKKTADKATSIFESPIRGNMRRRIRRHVTPMPAGKTLEPKNSLLKTIMVGTVQISVFLLLIMAITYPDAKC